MSSLQDILNVKLDGLSSTLKEGKVITAGKDTSVPAVLELLANNDIRSVPVVEDGKVVGVVDMLDIVTFIVRFADESSSLPATQRTFQWFAQQLSESGQNITQVAGLAHKSQASPVLSTATLFDIMQIMATSHVQRVPVMDADHKLINFITQSSFVQYFAKNSAALGNMEKCTLSELGFKNKPVHAVKETSTAIEAFRLMSQHKITGVPIVDTNGEIITNVSSKDLRHILTDEYFLDKLHLTAEKFVSDLKSKTFLHKSETMYPKICCKFSSTFGEVLHKLAATKIHRIYVVDEHEHPIGVISLHDIVSKVYEVATNKEVHARVFTSAH